MGLTKHEAVLGMVYVINESVCLRQRDDGYPGYPMVMLARQVWEDMGEPRTVTVTVEPGDGLNVQAASAAFFSSETPEPKALTGEFFDQQMHKAAVREGLE